MYKIKKFNLHVLIYIIDSMKNPKKKNWSNPQNLKL